MKSKRGKGVSFQIEKKSLPKLVTIHHWPHEGALVKGAEAKSTVFHYLDPCFFFFLGKPFGGRGKIQVTVGNKIMVWIRVLSFEGGIWVEFWLNFD